MVAAGRRDHALLRALARQQVGEGTARLERPRMLQELELEAQRLAGQPEIRGIDLDAPAFRGYAGGSAVGGFDVGA